MTEVEDWPLAMRAARGDMDAFTQLIRRYERPVIGFCYRMTGSRSDAEDVAQETFLRLYRALTRITQQASFSTLVFGIARNAALNHLRGRKRHTRKIAAFEQAPPWPANQAQRPDQGAHSRDVAALLEAGLAALPLELREALILREYQEFDYQRIAEVLGCPVGTVRSRIARAREQMRRYLLANGDELL
jgi:RNA polymerase sigma-70 factor (ECF subfamily)